MKIKQTLGKLLDRPYLLSYGQVFVSGTRLGVGIEQLIDKEYKYALINLSVSVGFGVFSYYSHKKAKAKISEEG